MRKARARTWLVLAGVELLLLAGAGTLVWLRFPDLRTELWAVLLGVAVLGVLGFEAARAGLAARRSRRYARSFDISDEIRRMSAETDPVGQSLVAEEILEEFVTAGRQHLKAGRAAEAVENFRRAIELDPHQSRLYNFLGMALGRLARHGDAIDAYQKAIAIDYDFTVAHFNLAVALEMMGRTGEALDEWRRYVEIGEVVGEREDMLDRARTRVRELEDGGTT